PKKNEKFAHKLKFLDEMTGYFQKRRSKQKSIMVGDLNIAPLEHDVWSHKQLLDVVSHTPIEVEKLASIKKAGKWVDAVRHFVPEDQKLFSWWSYRSPDWTRNDRGRRLDHIWVTPDLQKDLKQARIRKDMRGWQQPSDHVAVVLDFK
ncbi:MAG TPA: exodeoxyribonuclease III, partial [Alphaproteobacteria bacterium]|nr:exodeoxyribonuclease III [Alphaproteobacteria bacterium]